ncbi:hypothetical protein [Flavobacterium sp.]|uniref:hypothetical protein n=1 Tax=Flavobacterium sp. TaxID=239 RepID=UPI0037B9F88D
MKEIIFSNWHIMRWIRLAFSLFLFVQAYELREWFFIPFGLFFLFQALFNMGCGINGCAVPKYKINKDE